MVDLIENACRVYLGTCAARSDVNALFLGTGLKAPDILKECTVISDLASKFRLTWKDYVKAGVHPVDAFDAGLAVGVKLTNDDGDGEGHRLLGHPLNIALMFAKHLGDKHAGDRCVTAFHRIASALSSSPRIWDSSSLSPPLSLSAPTWDHPMHYKRQERYYSDRFYDSDLWVCPDPAPYGLQKLAGHDTTYMNFALVAWYNDDSIKTVLKKSVYANGQLVQVCNSMQIAGIKDISALLESCVVEALSTFWKDKRPKYRDVASLLRMLPSATATNMVKQAYGTKALLGITLKNADSESMSAGLSALAQQKDMIRNYSSLYGRAPTVTELCSLRAKALVDILYFMPWRILREALDEDDAGERLRARLLREVGSADPTMFRAALTEHDQRTTLDHYPLLDSPKIDQVTAKTTSTDWDRVFGELALRYQGAVAFRARLEHLIPNQWIRGATAMALFSKTNTFIEKILGTLPEWPEVLALSAGFGFLNRPLISEE